MKSFRKSRPPLRKDEWHSMDTLEEWNQKRQSRRAGWVKEVHQDPEKCGIREEYIGNREVFRRKIIEVKGLSEGNQRELKCY